MSITAGNKPYANYVLANEVEDQFLSHIDHARFCTVDTTLEGTPGMTKTIRKYFGKTTKVSNNSEVTDKDENATEILNLKAGNTKWIEMDYSDSSYTVLTAQNTGIWYDEEQMKDPYVGLVIAQKAGTDLFNKMNADIMGEFANATLTQSVTSSAFFNAIVDAQAQLNYEDNDAGAPETFLLANPKSVAALRKAANSDLKYVESFIRSGYVGTIAGSNVYASKIVPDDTLYLATKEAITLFVKTGTEVEDYQIYNRSSADADIRKNTIISRKYYIAALTNATKLVKITF